MTEREYDYDPILERIARECAQTVRSALTDEQYRDLVLRITRALQAEHDDFRRSREAARSWW
jgi:hypothetical protein